MVMDEALLKQALEFGKPYTGKGEVATQTAMML